MPFFSLNAMTQAWLRSNRRIFASAAAFPAIGLLFSLCLAMGFVAFLDVAWVRGVGVVLAAGGSISLGLLLRQAWVPRMGYKRGQLRLSLRLGSTVRVPLDVVEGFLLGQGPSWLPGKELGRAQARNLVIRLAEQAAEWERVDVFPVFGSWCGHYVTVRGAWCEPLTVPLVNRLNAQLHDAKAALQGKGEAT